ncbi:hypothetical protein [Actinoplanes philippinensis]|uniref:hypothetical protein n=1 Tax=Actinoplanes philippinensis TaxID=35752 RepID=UPI0034005631
MTQVVGGVAIYIDGTSYSSCMSVTITVETMTLGEIIRATDGSGLTWARYDELQMLPVGPAVYFWAGAGQAIAATEQEPTLKDFNAKILANARRTPFCTSERPLVGFGTVTEIAGPGDMSTPQTFTAMHA